MRGMVAGEGHTSLRISTWTQERQARFSTFPSMRTGTTRTMDRRCVDACTQCLRPIASLPRGASRDPRVRVTPALLDIRLTRNENTSCTRRVITPAVRQGRVFTVAQRRLPPFLTSIGSVTRKRSTQLGGRGSQLTNKNWKRKYTNCPSRDGSLRQWSGMKTQ